MNKDTLYVKRKRPTDMLLLAAIYISATLAVALLLGIILYVFVKGIHTVNWAFLTTVTSARKQTTGIAGNLLLTPIVHLLGGAAADAAVIKSYTLRKLRRQRASSF